MTPNQELAAIACRLNASFFQDSINSTMAMTKPLDDAVERVGKSWCQSWLGYHSCIYYSKLAVPPVGAHFSIEWGMMEVSVGDTVGDWEEFNSDDVKAQIKKMAKDPNLSALKTLSNEAIKQFNDTHFEVISILETALNSRKDTLLQSILSETKGIRFQSNSDILHAWAPSGQIISRDSLALTKGYRAPPHLEVAASLMAMKSPIFACQALARICGKAASHLRRQEKEPMPAAIPGSNLRTKVFIGHGRSSAWRDLKDFLHDRLRLPHDEFNRVPVAGTATTARLSEMLDSAIIAFIVLTAEDEMKDGGIQARMNVIHEAGLFQGRLGFHKAIVLLEDTCEEFSNIQGLGQIRFPKGNLRAVFEEIRRVLEREGVIKGDSP